jgi:DNA-binding NtrC family response regulator
LHGDRLSGRGCEDLYFRLAMFVVEVPPLRERREDIPLLVDHFGRILSEEMGLPKPPVSPDAERSLVAYDYPGNILISVRHLSLFVVMDNPHPTS